MVRRKSGLFPLIVFANNVNWDTHSISPSISFALVFLILSGLEGSGNSTRNERRQNDMPVNYHAKFPRSNLGVFLKPTNIFFDNTDTSVSLSFIL